MATFEAKKLDLTQINGGQEYEQGDFLQSDTINDVVEGTAYAQNVAEAANTTSNNAVSTANSANKTANDASTKVDTFDQRITTAQNTADTAVSNAATAQSTADSATTEINKIKNGTTVVPNANHANNADNADMATKAQQDVNGNPINTTYATVEYVDDLVTEQQGTRVKVNNANVAQLSFTSDPQTQINDIVNGAQTVGKATNADNATNANHATNADNATNATKATEADSATNASQLGGVDASGYMQVPSSVTNTSCSSGQWAVGAAAGAGTYLIGTFSVYDSNIHLKISGGIATSATDNTTDAEVFISVANYTVNKAVCFANKLYTTSTRTGLYYTIDSSHYLRIFAPMPNYGKLFISAEITGGTIVGKGSGSLQYPSGGEYIETNYYFATDPSKLEPSTANGWTLTTATGSLPSDGVYMVALSSLGITQGIGIMFYVESMLISTAAIGWYTGAVSLTYTPSGDPKWNLYDNNGTSIQLTDVHYKRIA